jgi:hypothetical protein
VASSFLDRAKNLLGLPAPASKVADSAVPAQAKLPKTWHAVTIAAGPRCCAPAKQLEGHRFLSKDAPPLPLKGCARTDCTCRYQHYDDRRKGPRRARELGVAMDGWVEEERRTPVRGRRKTDAR